MNGDLEAYSTAGLVEAQRFAYSLRTFGEEGFLPLTRRTPRKLRYLPDPI